MTESARDFISKLVSDNPSTSVDDLVRGLVGRYSDAELIQLGVAYIRDTVLHSKRRGVRGTEAKNRPNLASVTDTAMRYIGWQPLLDKEFSLGPNKPRVTYRDATVQDHQTIADYCRRLEAGNRETAELHEQAIADIIMVPGALTLGDVVSSSRAVP